MIKSGSASICYEVFENPDKDVLVLLHGNGESRKHFAKHIQLLKDDFHIVAVDSRGHGDSGFGSNSLSLSMMVIDLERILDELALDKVNILGFSDGANVAMMFAIKFPERVKKLILVGGNLNFKGMNMHTRFWVTFGYYFTKLAGYIDKKNKTYNEFYFIMYKEPNIPPEQLSVINCPTLVMAGTNDMIRTEHTKLIAKSIKNAELDLIENADHFYIYKEYEKFCKKAKDFLLKK